MILFFEIVNESNLTLELSKLILPFIIGLFSSVIIDKIRESIGNRKVKSFILMYLEKTILPELPEIEKITLNVKNKIQNYSSEKIMLPAFESFNSNVLRGIDNVQYYKVFKKEYVLLNEIISMIDFLCKNMPTKINDNYYDYINQHLREKNKIGDLLHVKNCYVCVDKKEDTIRILDSRIKEIKILKEKIELLIK
ncbi:hypothetical protein H9I45_02185 [Polaribacter haliotis]|uniref:Uncharacterized protein n=1 Tax=Polaribacter haliotis TaxID=1888915 RepID=A0A7L8AHL0_9FLAO|nr:hypothetical protein [Polaribacter haliotis]QOD61279.1 hypothetical protein H9I45_02185 [Polaribacter haliotis]